MKLLVQRVAWARIEVEGAEIARIGRGMLVFVGVERGDGPGTVGAAAERLATFRIFADEAGRMNLSLRDVGGEALVVSQFTLAAAVDRGRRPSFEPAAPPDVARPLVEALVERLAAAGIPTRQGRFGADMQVELRNDGPVTFHLDVR